VQNIELSVEKKRRVGKKGQGELNAPPRASKAGMSNTEAGGWLPRAVFLLRRGQSSMGKAGSWLKPIIDPSSQLWSMDYGLVI